MSNTNTFDLMSIIEQLKRSGVSEINISVKFNDTVTDTTNTTVEQPVGEVKIQVPAVPEEMLLGSL